MNKLFAIALGSLLIHSLSFATTIKGSPAQQLYGLLKVSPELVDGVNVKNFGKGWQCQEKMLIDDTSPFVVYEYQCLVPEKAADGRVYFDATVSQNLYDVLGSKHAQQTLRTTSHYNVIVRTLLAIECRLQDYIGGATEYKCSIAAR